MFSEIAYLSLLVYRFCTPISQIHLQLSPRLLGFQVLLGDCGNCCGLFFFFSLSLDLDGEKN